MVIIINYYCGNKYPETSCNFNKLVWDNLIAKISVGTNDSLQDN